MTDDLKATGKTRLRWWETILMGLGLAFFLVASFVGWHFVYGMYRTVNWFVTVQEPFIHQQEQREAALRALQDVANARKQGASTEPAPAPTPTVKSK